VEVLLLGQTVLLAAWPHSLVGKVGLAQQQMGLLMVATVEICICMAASVGQPELAVVLPELTGTHISA